MSPAIPENPRLFLAAHHLGERWRRYILHPCPGNLPRGRTPDESTTEHARLSRRRIIEHAGLARRNALFAGDELHFITTIDRAQPGRLRRARRARAHEHLDAGADDAIERAVADPVDVAQLDAIHPQRLARTNHDAAAGGFEPDDIERRGRG